MEECTGPLVCMEMNQTLNFWKDKSVLITGHTGFKGAWLSMWLHKLGAKVTGVSLEPATIPNIFTEAKLQETINSHFCDIRDAKKLSKIIKQSQPEIVFHLAAQALVRESYQTPLDTFSTNIMGTAHVLEALHKIDSVKVAVIVTTDKVYRNHERQEPYCETDTLGGHDPYSASKAACEIVIDSYRDSFLKTKGIAVASARAGNVIGGGDWSADRLIPDIVTAWHNNQAVHIRRPNAVRPWQHVLEPLFGYLTLAQHLWNTPTLAGAFNFGPRICEAATVREVIELAKPFFPEGKVEYGTGQEGPHEASLLTLDISKSSEQLGIVPRWNLKESVSKTIKWYQSYYLGQNITQLCEQDIQAFENSK